ncbi:uncharacterized protein LOC127420119 isoform X2 [Myxocyprinus asiaticus]|uniref:uncharacterized protein LOC127420119 isoform X2 n=1 Tax=Myxocyprinus asiaticus TaxID=70543 RepID=UPI002221A028|nr:uncharacterized protein LOC127420119 isoform X2 [Myxocyprinus asiaticus]
MLVVVTLICLIDLSSAHPIIQKDVLDELVTQTNSERETLDMLNVTKGAVINTTPQTAAQSSSESESSEQSESVEDLSETSEEHDTSEQTSESLETTFQQHTASDDLRDDSRGSKENIRRSWVRVHGLHFDKHAVTLDVTADTVTDIATAAVVTEAAETLTDGVIRSFQTAQTIGVTAAVAVETDSAASKSMESDEQVDLQQLNMCKDQADNDECIDGGFVKDGGDHQSDFHHGALSLDERPRKIPFRLTHFQLSEI